ncbi:RNA methyltransferase, TrmH family [Actinomyces sp. oral taxon 848 str. F0332]|nr:RNA methyltransferase, TrmH family [Actinomyces sp. oral taxon 848 str. F0332]
MKLRTKEATRSQLQRAQRLHRREQRSRHGQTLVEGPQAVRELLACASGLARDLYVTEEAIERHGDVAELASAAGVWTHVLAAQDMRDLSADAQGVVAVISTPEAPGLNSLLGEASLVVATLDIADPGNLGTIIRTADAAGADAVAVGKASAELYSPKVMRSAAGSHFHVPCVAGVEASELAARAREAGLQVLTAEGTGEWELPVLIREAAEARILGAAPSGPDLRRRTLWFVGNEARGFAGCDFDVDARVAVPLYGKAESLNVSTALAVCAYASAMAQRAD